MTSFLSEFQQFFDANFMGNKYRKKKQTNFITGLDRPLGFQEVEAPRI
jgi:hypothetical protein